MTNQKTGPSQPGDDDAAPAGQQQRPGAPGDGRLSFLAWLEACGATAAPGHALAPSLLQRKLCAGANQLSSCLAPMPSADGLGFQDLPPPCSSSTSNTSSTGSSPAALAAAQFGLALLQATHVVLPAVGGRQPARCAARLCLFDRASHRLLGNVHCVPVASTKPGRGLGGAPSATWMWGPREQPGSCGSCATPDAAAATAPPWLQPLPPGRLAGSAATHAPPAGPAACAAAAATAAGGALVAAAGGCGGDVAGLGGANACVVRAASEVRDPVAGLRELDGERLAVLVELTVAYTLAAEDAAEAVVPQAESQGAGLVDELCCAWAMISLRRCAELAREMTISVPLYCGSLIQPTLLAAVWEAHRKAHPIRSLFTASPQPQLTFRAGPLPPQRLPLLPYSAMPRTLIARRDVAWLLAAARLALEQRLQAEAVAGGAAAAAALPLADAALAALPSVLDDAALRRELLARWDARLRGLHAAASGGQADCLLVAGSCAPGCASAAGGPVPPSREQLLAALRASVLEVAPLLHCASLPPPHLASFAAHAAHRAAVAARFCRGVAPAGAAAQQSGRGRAVACGCAAHEAPPPCGRHPVEPLSTAGGEFLHRPFDVAETRLCVADALLAERWVRC